MLQEPGNQPESFLKGIAESFQKTPTEILIFIFLVLGIILFFLLAFLIFKLIARYRFHKTLAYKYNKYLKVFKLTGPERDIIERMSRFLKKPEKKYLLLLNVKTFHAALNILQQSRKEEENVLASLKKKLGFDSAHPDSIITGTTDLRASMPVLVMHNIKNKIHGTIIESARDSLTVSLLQQNNEIKEHDAVMLFVHNFTGIYMFQTVVLENRQSILVLKHSLEKKRFQRREFYRKQMRLPVLIQRTGYQEQLFPAVIEDLSAGGAALDITGKNLKKGDDLKIFFKKQTQDAFLLNAEVLRVSQNGSKVFVRFGHLSDNSIDRLIEMINIEK